MTSAVTVTLTKSVEVDITNKSFTICIQIFCNFGVFFDDIITQKRKKLQRTRPQMIKIIT